MSREWRRLSKSLAGKNTPDPLIKENRGKIAIFEEAMKAANEDMLASIKVILEKRAKLKKM